MHWILYLKFPDIELFTAGQKEHSICRANSERVKHVSCFLQGNVHFMGHINLIIRLSKYYNLFSKKRKPHKEEFKFCIYLHFKTIFLITISKTSWLFRFWTVSGHYFSVQRMSFQLISLETKQIENLFWSFSWYHCSWRPRFCL